MNIPILFAMYDQTPLYTLNAAASITHISPDIICRWEQCYGLPQPVYTPNGDRRYSEQDLEIIKWLYKNIQQGVSIQQAIGYSEEFSIEAAQTALLPAIIPYFVYIEKIYSHLLMFNRTHALNIFEKALNTYGVESVCLEIIQPLMCKIGKAWATGEASIAQEHFSSSIIQGMLALFIKQIQIDTQRGVIMLLTPIGERHELGIQMLSVFLLRRGWQVLFLGTDMPIAELVAIMDVTKPDVVALAATNYTIVDQVAQSIRLLISLPNAPLVGYGGYAFNTSQYRAKMPGIYLGRDARQACSHIEQLLN